jgi:ubiquinone/menaquinone biosynthesis C-methylase UbiE
MVLERLRHEFNRWAERGRGRGMEKSNWEVTRQLIDSMNVDEHDNIADLGCGLGWATRVLAQKASRGFVVGIDLSERMIALARSGSRNPPNTLFLVADSAKLPCGEAFFDSLISVEFIYYHPHLDEVFSETRRIIKAGAKAFFLISYYKENPHGHDWAKYIEVPVDLLGTEEYLARLSDAGFRSVAHRRLVNSNPIPEDWKPTQWFPTREIQAKFQSEGSLLLTAEK